jgi:hypothetical protein
MAPHVSDKNVVMSLGVHSFLAYEADDLLPQLLVAHVLQDIAE